MMFYGTLSMDDAFDADVLEKRDGSDEIKLELVNDKLNKTKKKAVKDREVRSVTSC